MIAPLVGLRAPSPSARARHDLLPGMDHTISGPATVGLRTRGIDLARRSLSFRDALSHMVLLGQPTTDQLPARTGLCSPSGHRERHINRWFPLRDTSLPLPSPAPRTAPASAAHAA